MQWSAQVTIFDAAGTYGPAIRLTDIFPDTTQVRATPGCAEMGILGSVAGMVGTMLATEAIKLLLGVGRTLLGRMLVIDTLDMTPTEIPLAPSKPGETIRVTAVPPQVLDATTPVVEGRRTAESAELRAPVLRVQAPF